MGIRGKERLDPLPMDGKAQVMLVAIDARFMGLRFRELSVSVLASSDDCPDEQVVLLVAAFQFATPVRVLRANFVSDAVRVWRRSSAG